LVTKLSSPNQRFKGEVIKTKVTFPDANLETAIREAIDKPRGPIYTSNLEAATTVEADLVAAEAQIST